MTARDETEFDRWAARFHEQYEPGSRLEREFRLTRTLVLAARRWTGFADGLIRARTGHTRARWQTLSALSYSDGPVATLDLARRMSLRWPPLIRVLKELEAEGLVHRRRDVSDRRSRLVEITPDGLRVVAEVRDIIAPARSDMLASFSDGELDQAEQVLNRLLARLIAGEN